MVKIGSEIRRLRKEKDISLRAFAEKVGVKPPYLSRVENGEVPASEDLIIRSAKVLEQSPDVLCAISGKVTTRLAKIISKHPKAFTDLLIQLENAPEHAVLRVCREVRDGKW